MADLPDNPLSEDHYQQIKNGLDILKSASNQIALARRANIKAFPNGVSVDDLASQIADKEQQLLQLKNVYFPGR